ncbi:LytR family transcriptional regulator [Janibacter sp. Soil728]|uniref:LytR/AlgR family response regulator transcription factor n=1 Tax=Janibacter sp. Soil728 TaxID=1736393 RepID=UPI000700302C|nr:LytTR family DNA-binding domain-containing protein [Janibacter sp. Soil728]KRE35092.1 LytR family transcriptional regulator [Janibacter sp. Soil728]
MPRPPQPAALTVLVVDDEAPARNEVAWLLDQDERVGRVLTASSGTAALAALEREPIDVVFSDISMPGLDGMQLARVIRRFTERPQVVFVTAHDTHAVDAFDLDAVDYIMKPVRPERIGEAVRRCLASSERDTPASATPEDDETIPVELGGVTRFVPRSDIRWVQAQGDYARLHTPTGSHLVRIPLATLEEQWADAGFVRIHRSTLVSTRHISEIHNDGGRCTVIVDDIELQVSRRHTRHLRGTLLRPRTATDDG